MKIKETLDIDPVYEDDYLYKSFEGLCQYCHKGEGYRLTVIGTYSQLAEHEINEHYDIWAQVERAHGIRQ